MTDRKVFGGDGILPDEVVKLPSMSERQISLLDPMFFFVREAANGRIAGFVPSARIINVSYGTRIAASDLPQNAALVSAFESYLLSHPEFNISGGIAPTEAAFVGLRLRYEVAIANFGSVLAQQVLIEDDAQAAKAIEALPRAAQLAQNAARAKQNPRK